jgi:hypothetical protein
MTDLATIILLLGSYDRETKSTLNKIREEIAKLSVHYDETIFTLLLENVEIYETDTDWICIEKFGEKKTIILFKRESIEVKDVIEFDAKEDDIEILKRLGYKSFIRIPILEKLRVLATISSLVFVIRHKELTRGGEYIELAFLLSRGLDPRIVYMLVKSDVKISAMLKELIDLTEINFRVYENDEELLDEIRRILYYKVIKRSKRF